MSYKVIFIDVVKQQVSEIDVKKIDCQTCYKFIDCELITAPSFDENHDLICDDCGAIRGRNKMFGFNGTPQYFGNAMIAGVNQNEGTWISHSLNFEEIKKSVSFFNLLATPIGNVFIKYEVATGETSIILPID